MRQHNQGAFPDGVNARLQYGTGVRALVVLLNVAFKLPVKKVQILEDLYGSCHQPSHHHRFHRRCFERLARWRGCSGQPTAKAWSTIWTRRGWRRRKARTGCTPAATGCSPTFSCTNVGTGALWGRI
ncbi:MAG: hypothetical protein IPM82_11730 [Saprospiraceae bacterium]|nr:hypothetical protein [Saprospiraceae bacterium]